MVLGSVLTVLISSSLSCLQLSEQAALERGIEFCRSVEKGPYEPTGSLPHRYVIDETKRGPDWIAFQFRNCFVSIDRRSGRVRGYWDVRSVPEGRERLDSNELQRLAEGFFSLAGFDEELDVWECDSSGIIDLDGKFELTLLRKHEQISFTQESGVEMSIDASTGRLKSYGVLDWNQPSAPVNLVPSISGADAHIAMTARVFARYPRFEELFVHRPVRLGIWRPDPNPSAFHEYNLTPAQVQMGRDNKGILVYWATYIDREHFSDGRFAFLTYIDAHSGQTLASWDNTGGGRIGGGGSKKRIPFAWDLGPSDMTFAFGKNSTAIKQGRIDRSLIKPKEANSASVMLQIGRMSLNCKYYEKDGLLGLTRGGKETYGRPDGAILRALKKLVPLPSANK